MMLWWQIVLTIVLAAVAVFIEEIVRRYLKRREQKPDFGGSFTKVKKDISRIKKKLDDMSFYPDLILGISGENLVGGTIVGAWLASDSFLRRPERFRQAFRNRELSEELKREIIENKWRKLLLVDDVSQHGDTIRQELDELEKLVPGGDVRVAVIVVREDSWGRLRDELWKNPGKHCIYCHPNVPDEVDVRWPWKI